MSSTIARSTKGASKQRRENINNEIKLMKDLLPLPTQVKKRLGQLQVMALGKALIAKSNAFSSKNNPCEKISELVDFSQILPGFLFVTSMNWKLLYLSEETMEHIFHSMVDLITQTDSLLDIVHPEDCCHFSNVVNGVAANKTKFNFFCRLGMLRSSKRNHSFDRYKMMRVSLRVMSNEKNEKFMVGLISPRINSRLISENSPLFDTCLFKTVHHMDMKFKCLDENGEFFLGCKSSEVNKMSWYQFLHPEDLERASQSHKNVLENSFIEKSVTFPCRLLTSNNDIIYLVVVMSNKKTEIECVNQVVEWDEFEQALREEYQKGELENEKSSLKISQDNGNRKNLLEKIKNKVKNQDQTIISQCEVKSEFPVRWNSPVEESVTFQSSQPVHFSPSSETGVTSDFMSTSLFSSDILQDDMISQSSFYPFEVKKEGETKQHQLPILKVHEIEEILPSFETNSFSEFNYQGNMDYEIPNDQFQELLKCHRAGFYGNNNLTF